MPSILIISFVEWAGAFQRPQHLAIGLSRRGASVTYACPGYVHRRPRQVASGLDLPESLQVIEPAALPGESRLKIVAWINERSMLRSLSRLRTKPWDLIIFNDPRWADLAGRLPARQRVFDCMDDLSALTPGQGLARQRRDRALDVADRVWTGTAMLADALADHHAHVHFIPCGVDAARFCEATAADVDRIRGDLPPGDGPLAGYFGMINERFDLDRVMALLESGPWRVLLIGPSSSRAPRLPDHPRLRWIGPRPYADLPAYLAAFDLAMIPYDITGPNRFLYPVKALEYLAGGKPVLSTPLPDVVRFLSDYVVLADTPDQWAEAGRRFLAETGAFDPRTLRGQAYARSRSWDAMIDEMQKDLDEGRSENDAKDGPGDSRS